MATNSDTRLNKKLAEVENIIAELARAEKLLEKRRDLTDKEVLRQLEFFRRLKLLAKSGPLDPMRPLLSGIGAGLKGLFGTGSVTSTILGAAEATKPVVDEALVPVLKDALGRVGVKPPKMAEVGPVATIDKLISLFEKYPHEPIRLRAKEEFEAARLQNLSPLTHSDATEKRMRDAERALQEQDEVLKQLIEITRSEREKASARGDHRLAADHLQKIQKYEGVLAMGRPAPFQPASVLPKPIVPPVESVKAHTAEVVKLSLAQERVIALQIAAYDAVAAGSSAVVGDLESWINGEQRVAAAILGVSDAQLAIGVANEELDLRLEESLARMSQGLQGVGQASAGAVNDTKNAALEIDQLLSGLGENVKDTLASGLQSVLDGKVKSIGDLVNQVGGTVSSELKNFVGTKATDALGGMLGSFSAFAGPLGGVIGSAAGALASKAIGALGKVLGGKPSDKVEGTLFDLADGTRSERDLGRGKDSPENRALATEIENQVRRVNDALKGAGLPPSAGSFMIEVGSGKNLAPFRGSVGGGAVQSFQTKDQMLAFFTQQLAGSLQGIPEKLQAYINSIDYTNVEKFVAEIGRIAGFKEGMEGIHDQILQLTDPKAWDLKRIDDEFKGILEQANQFGTEEDIAAINRLKGLRREEADGRHPSRQDRLSDLLGPINQALNPREWELQQLTKEFQRLREEATALEATSEQLGSINQVEETRRQEIIARHGAPLRDLMTPITDELAQILDPRQFELDKLAEEFERLRSEAIALGATTQQLEAIDQLEQARRAAPLREAMEFVRGDMRSMDAAAKDPQTRELDDLRERYDEMQALAQGHADELADIEEWYGRRRTEIADRYAQEAQRIAAEQAQAILEQVTQQARDNINQQIDVLARQRETIEASIGQYRSILDGIKAAKARFAGDPRLSPASNEQRLADLMRQLNDAAAKAQNGDKEAAAEIGELAMAAAEANVAFNASSEEGARVQRDIANILNATGNLIDSELRLAERELEANEEQVDVLRQILAKIDTAPPPAPTTAADMIALVTAYGQANAKHNFGAMSPEQISGNPVWKAFEDQLFDYIGRLENSRTSIDWLERTLAWAPTELNTPFEFAARRRVPKLMNRLRDFGITPIRPPGFAAGGRTGHLALVHPNEMIYTGPPAMVYNARETASMMSGGNVLRELQGIRADIGVLSRTVSIAGEDQVVQLSRHDMRLAAIESNFSLARARA